MINWKPEGRQKPGRPRRTWKDGIQTYTAMSERGLRMGEWKNRRQWKTSPDVLKPRYIYIYIYIQYGPG
jgi:hypothetical protein